MSKRTVPGSVSGTAFDRYSVLRTTEEILGLPSLLNACNAASMRLAFGLQ